MASSVAESVRAFIKGSEAMAIEDMGRVFARLATAAEYLVDLALIDHGMEPVGPLVRHPEVKPLSVSTPADVNGDLDLLYRLELFARAQGFSGPEQLDDIQSFALQQGWITPDGEVLVTLPESQP